MKSILRLLTLLFLFVTLNPLTHPTTSFAEGPYDESFRSIWPTGPVLDQGRTPECTVYALMGLLEAGPYPLPAEALPTIDELWQASRSIGHVTNPESGVAVEWAVQYLEEKGLVIGERDTLDTGVAIYWLRDGPLVATAQWHASMDYPDEHGLVDISGPKFRPDGEILGGHAFLVYGYDPVADVFLVQNSWGTWWGKEGTFLIKRTDLQAIMTEWNGRYYHLDTRWYIITGSSGGRGALTL